MTIFYSILGLSLLVLGANILVNSSSKMALAFNISPLVIGLTIVAFGTSAPELAVSVQSSISGQDNIVISNVVGSNIFNVLFILGLTALISPLAVASQLIKLEAPLLIFLSILIYGLSFGGRLSQFDGVLLFSLFIGYTVFIIIQSKKENSESIEDSKSTAEMKEKYFWTKNILFVITGLGMLIFGSELLIQSVVKMARNLNVSEEVIGLTVVAAGTSMPELVTSVVAALRGKIDMAVGNILGSNVFNILVVAGLSSAINSKGCFVSESMLAYDIPVMIAVSILCLPVFITERMISRFEGITFLILYVAYTVCQVLAVRGSTQNLAELKFLMLYFLLPFIGLFFIGRILAKSKRKDFEIR